MYKIAAPVFLICETPLHAGSGDSLGVVDLPIQRERHTSFPKIEGSSLKGAIRQAFEDFIVIKSSKPIDISKQDDGKEITYDLQKIESRKFEQPLYDQLKQDWKVENRKKDKHKLLNYHQSINLTFGPENAGNEGHAGALGFTDARLLLFPVKSMKGVFAWITCPKVLKQFYRDMSLTGFQNEAKIKHALTLDKLTTPEYCSLFLKEKDNKIVLEEYTFEITNNDSSELKEFSEWLSENITSENFWKEKMKTDIVVLSDEDFTDFVNLSTEVITRTKINNETGTVESGALFTEEYLPAESVMYSLALASPIFKEKDEEKGIFKQANGKEEDLVMEFFKKGLPEVIQVGGNATLGKGLVRTCANCNEKANGGNENGGK